MVDPLWGLANKLLAASVRETMAPNMSFSAIGSGCGTGRKSLTLMVSSGSCLHRVDSALVLAAVLRSTLAKIYSKTSSVGALSLSSSLDCWNRFIYLVAQSVYPTIWQRTNGEELHTEIMHLVLVVYMFYQTVYYDIICAQQRNLQHTEIKSRKESWTRKSPTATRPRGKK